MDNVLIDDRRIHVDFSQSVAKVKWKGKGKTSHANLCTYWAMSLMIVVDLAST